jgi:hypothetical protein
MTDTERQAFMAVHLSPKSIGACTIQFDNSQPSYTSVKEDAWKKKCAPDENVCQVSKLVVSVSGIQLPVFSLRSQVC